MTGDNESSPLLQSARQHVGGVLHGESQNEGESHRTGFQPSHFLPIIWRSSNPVSNAVNILWPFVPVAIILRYAATGAPLWIFATR